MARPRSVVLSATVLLAALLLAGLMVRRGTSPEEGTGGGTGDRFEVALIGDARYRPDEYPKFLRLRDEINAEEVAFTVHIGDIKGGGPCSDRLYEETRQLFDDFSSPLVYTPGDNEWTDCGDRRPTERLAFLRRVFFPDDQSRGRRRLSLERQRPDYPENARWSYGKVTFATIHAVGSNNNLPDPSEPEGTVGDAREFEARNAADLEWLRSTFEKARVDGSVAVVLAMQADPAFERAPGQRAGFEALLSALRRQTQDFAKPVVVVHGDSHVQRVDKPLVDPATGRVVENLTRVETFGSPDIHWVRATVDPRDPKVFTFRPELVEANRAP